MKAAKSSQAVPWQNRQRIRRWCVNGRCSNRPALADTRLATASPEHRAEPFLKRGVRPGRNPLARPLPSSTPPCTLPHAQLGGRTSTGLSEGGGQAHVHCLRGCRGMGPHTVPARIPGQSSPRILNRPITIEPALVTDRRSIARCARFPSARSGNSMAAHVGTLAETLRRSFLSGKNSALPGVHALALSAGKWLFAARTRLRLVAQPRHTSPRHGESGPAYISCGGRLRKRASE